MNLHAHLASARGDATSHVARTTSDNEEALWDVAGIAECLEFIRGVPSRYPAGEAEVASIARSVSRIEHRMAWPSITLGVVGEFSAGKSTLVNGLIGVDLLPMDTLQGTTAAITLITRSAEPFAKAVYTDGTKSEMTARHIDAPALREFVRGHIVNEERAARLAQLRIGIPAACLRHNVTLIDTPGLNSLTARHSSEALRAVREMCDAFLVAIPSVSPLSQSMVNFLAANLRGNFHRCIFVITKSDLLRNAAEEHRVRTSVRERLLAALEMHTAPKLVACSAEIALASHLGRDPNEGLPRPLVESCIDAFCEEFTAFRSKLMADLEVRQSVARLESLVDMCQVGLRKAAGVIEGATRQWEREEAGLEAEPPCVTEEAFEERGTRLLMQLEDVHRHAVADAERWLAVRLDQSRAELRMALVGATDAQQAKSRAMTALPEKIKALSDGLAERYAACRERLLNCGRAGIESLASGACGPIQQTAAEAFLAADAMKVMGSGWGRDHGPIVDDAKKAFMEQLQRTEAKASEGWSGVATCAIGGAVVGSWIPVVGTMAGGVAGLVTGLLSASKLQVAVDDVGNEAVAVLATAIAALRTWILADEAAAANVVKDHVARTIAELKATALPAVRREREERNVRRTLLAERLRAARDDRARLAACENTIGVARERCVAQWQTDRE